MTKRITLILAIVLLCTAPSRATVYYYVATTGSDANPGTITSPFLTLEGARNAIRNYKQANGLPVGGITVLIRGGVYPRTTSFDLQTQDSGSASAPIVYQAYPGEEVRIVGGAELQAGWFSLVTSASPVWSRLDPLAQGNVVQVNLPAHGITDYGTLQPRGFNSTAIAALELFFAD